MADGDGHSDGRSPWFLLAIVLVLLLLIASGGRAVWRSQTGTVAAVFSRGEGVVDLIGEVLGFRTHHRCKPNVGSNLRQIGLGMICYSSEEDGVWPRDFKLLQDWSDGELAPKLFRDPRWPSDPDPFVYVRPTKTAKAAQPILLTRPTTGSHVTVVICYGDGHIGTVTGRAQWDEARRLAALPKALAEGIAPEDWTTVPELRARSTSAP